jgi:hypothetical protein
VEAAVLKDLIGQGVLGGVCVLCILAVIHLYRQNTALQKARIDDAKQTRVDMLALQKDMLSAVDKFESGAKAIIQRRGDQ